MQIDIDIQASKWDAKTKTREAIIDINATRLNRAGYLPSNGALALPALTITPADDSMLQNSQELGPGLERDVIQNRENAPDDKQRDVSDDHKSPKLPPPAPIPAQSTSPKREKHREADEEAQKKDKKDGRDKKKPKKKLMMNWFALLWILAFLLTAALAIAALVVDEWAVMENSPTDTELYFGLWYDHENRMPSCNASDVAEVTMKAEYSEFRLNLVIAFMIVGIILDGVSLFLGIFVLIARLKGRDRHWAWSIPTIIAVLLAGDFILAACAVFVWDLDHVPGRREAIENSNCTTFVLYVYMTVNAQTSFFLAIASACFCLLKALIFGLLAHKIRRSQSKQDKEDDDISLRDRSKSDNSGRHKKEQMSKLN